MMSHKPSLAHICIQKTHRAAESVGRRGATEEETILWLRLCLSEGSPGSTLCFFGWGWGGWGDGVQGLTAAEGPGDHCFWAWERASGRTTSGSPGSWRMSRMRSTDLRRDHSWWLWLFSVTNEAAEMVTEFIQDRVCGVVPTEKRGDAEDPD